MLVLVLMIDRPGPVREFLKWQVLDVECPEQLEPYQRDPARSVTESRSGCKHSEAAGTCSYSGLNPLSSRVRLESALRFSGTACRDTRELDNTGTGILWIHPTGPRVQQWD